MTPPAGGPTLVEIVQLAAHRHALGETGHRDVAAGEALRQVSEGPVVAMSGLKRHLGLTSA